MNSNEILSEIIIRCKSLSGKYKSSSNFLINERGDSFYSIQKRGEQKPVQLRLSNHGTNLKTWTDRKKLSDSKTRIIDPAHCINISIVFLDEGNNLTNDCIGQVNCDDCQITLCVPTTFEGQNELGRHFEVKQYVYESSLITPKDIEKLAESIMDARFSGVYLDPLQAQASERELSSQPNVITKGNKTNKNMKKNKIRITENELKQIVTESIEKILNEGTWYGDIKPFEKIYNAANQIIHNLEYINNDNYEEVGDDYSYDSMYNWAIKVRDDAEYYIRNNSSNTSINGGEEW